MVGSITHELAAAGLNIATMTNKSRRDLAYTVMDVDSDVPARVITAIEKIDGVLMVRPCRRPADRDRHSAQKPIRSGTDRPSPTATFDHGMKPSSHITRADTSSRCSSVLIWGIAAR